jgi:hypothetical protein
MQSRSPSLCSACLDGYERERADMASSPGCGALHATEQPMSQWLQIGTPSSARPPFDRAQVGSVWFFCRARQRQTKPRRVPSP